MYNRTLRIGLFGIDDDIAAALEELLAPERFSFEFIRADTIDYMKAFDCSIAIAAMGSWGNAPLLDISAAIHHEQDIYRGFAIVAAPEDIASWSSSDLAMVDAIWPAPLTPERAVFEFERMVAEAKQEAETYLARTYLNTLIDSIPAMVWFKAIDGEYLKVNNYYCDVADKPQWDVEGQLHDYIWSVPPEDREKIELACKESDDAALEAGETVQSTEAVSSDGETRTFDAYKTPIFDEDGTVLGIVGFACEIAPEG